MCIYCLTFYLIQRYNFLLALKNGVFMKKQLFGNQIVIHVAAQKCAEGLFQGTVSGLIILPDRG